MELNSSVLDRIWAQFHIRKGHGLLVAAVENADDYALVVELDRRGRTVTKRPAFIVYQPTSNIYPVHADRDVHENVQAVIRGEIAPHFDRTYVHGDRSGAVPGYGWKHPLSTILIILAYVLLVPCAMATASGLSSAIYFGLLSTAVVYTVLGLLVVALVIAVIVLHRWRSYMKSVEFPAGKRVGSGPVMAIIAIGVVVGGGAALTGGIAGELSSTGGAASKRHGAPTKRRNGNQYITTYRNGFVRNGGWVSGHWKKYKW